MLAAALLALPAHANAGSYVVAQCDKAHAAYDDARFDRTSGAYYSFARDCSGGSGPGGLRIADSSAAPVGAQGRIKWWAPSGASIVGVSAEAALRSDAGHRARLAFINAAGAQTGRIATGPDAPGGFRHYAGHLDGTGKAGFAALLICANDRPCPRSEQARTAVRNVRLTVRDGSRPKLTPSGTLLAGGWLRGSARLAVAASDSGSGLYAIEIDANGKRLPLSRVLSCQTVAGGGVATAMSPCPHRGLAGGDVATGAAPFRDGANSVRVCARDFGPSPNSACVQHRVLVDNTSPAASFRPADDSDPELIAADVSDASSGVALAGIYYRPVAGGTWRQLATKPVGGGIAGRIDSESLPPGRYAFRIIAADRAGNSRVVSTGRDGKPMVLQMPLLERTRIRTRIAALGHRVAYGTRPRLRGRIATSTGRRLAGSPLTVIERFDAGSRPRIRRHQVRSGPGGAFSLRLAKGPSRKVVVRFAGSRSLVASRSRARKLAVTGRVRLRISHKRVRAGRRVRFSGRIGTVGARVPKLGKVVELQVREPHQRDWRTVGDALHSSRRGRIRTAYRFGRFYRRPARFAFRLKVTRQAGWPYRAPTHSRPRRLVVEPRH